MLTRSLLRRCAAPAASTSAAAAAAAPAPETVSEGDQLLMAQAAWRAEMASHPDTQRVFVNMYRTLLRLGEDRHTMRRVVLVYQPKTVATMAGNLLKLHKQANAAETALYGARWYQPLRKVSARIARRKAWGRMYVLRAKARGGAALSDVFVFLALCVGAYVGYQSMYVLYVAMWRAELLNAMIQPLLEVVSLIEHQGRANMEASK